MYALFLNSFSIYLFFCPVVVFGWIGIRTVRSFLLLLFDTEEKFAQAVCFLLVDLYLLTYQAEKALHLLAVLEKMISQGNNNSKNGKNEVSLKSYECCSLY